MTVVNGIHQSDIIIRSAILAGIADLRAKPYLLDYVFASLPKDELTASAYGTEELEKAKRWFLKTRIPVVMATRLGEAKLPAVSIRLLESMEAESTLGDLHHDVAESHDPSWKDLTDRFQVTSYQPTTGYITLPQSVLDELVVVPGMFISDTQGRSHEILSEVDDTTFAIQAGTMADFSKAAIRYADNSDRVSLEHVRMSESYSIGCHVDGDQNQLTYLHSIIAFILLRYKESLLEARGFDESKISSSDVMFHTDGGGDQPVSVVGYARYIKISGKIIQSWPKVFAKPIMKVQLITTVNDELWDVDFVTGVGTDGDD